MSGDCAYSLENWPLVGQQGPTSCPNPEDCASLLMLDFGMVAVTQWDSGEKGEFVLHVRKMHKDIWWLERLLITIKIHFLLFWACRLSFSQPPLK